MAKLIHDAAQVQAMNEINELIAQVEQINARLRSTLPFEIIAEKKSTITLDSKFDKAVRDTLKKQRADRIAVITRKARLFRIELDEKDLEAVGDSATE